MRSSTMKEHHGTKEAKKQPTKTLKERRAAKQARKDAQATANGPIAIRG